MQPSDQPKESPGWAANPRYVIDWDLVPAKVSVSFNGTVVAESDQVRVMYELGTRADLLLPEVGTEYAVLRGRG